MKTLHESLKKYIKEPIEKGLELQAIHTYTDAEGNELWIRIRLKHRESGEKWIRPFHLKNGNYIPGEGFQGTKKPLYNLKAIVDNPIETIYLVEGEYIVDKLAKFGLLATTTGGASNLDNVDWSPIADRTIILWPDYDQAGIKFGIEATKRLESLYSLVKWINVDALELEEKDDFINYWRKHPSISKADIEALPLVDAPDIDVKSGQVVKKAHLVSYTESIFLELELLDRKRALPWLYEQSLNMVYSWRGVGKTYFALSCARALASGGKVLEWQAERPYKVAYIDGEMPAKTLQERLRKLYLADKLSTYDNLRIFPYELQDPITGMPDLATIEGQAVVDQATKDSEIIFLDNLSCLVRGSGKENEAETWSAVQLWLTRLRASGKTVIFLHHAGKGGAQRGTSKREDLLDEVICLKRPTDYDVKDGCVYEVHFEKPRNNFGEIVEPIQAKLINNDDGSQSWEISKVAENTFEKIVSLYLLRIKQSDIAKEVGVSSAYVSKSLRKAREAGLIDRDDKIPWGEV